MYVSRLQTFSVLSQLLKALRVSGLTLECVQRGR